MSEKTETEAERKARKRKAARERRRKKILGNTETRMKKVFGQATTKEMKEAEKEGVKKLEAEKKAVAQIPKPETKEKTKDIGNILESIQKTAARQKQERYLRIILMSLLAILFASQPFDYQSFSLSIFLTIEFILFSYYSDFFSPAAPKPTPGNNGGIQDLFKDNPLFSQMKQNNPDMFQQLQGGTSIMSRLTQFFTFGSYIYKILKDLCLLFFIYVCILIFEDFVNYMGLLIVENIS